MHELRGADDWLVVAVIDRYAIPDSYSNTNYASGNISDKAVYGCWRTHVSGHCKCNVSHETSVRALSKQVTEPVSTDTTYSANTQYEWSLLRCCCIWVGFMMRHLYCVSLRCVCVCAVCTGTSKSQSVAVYQNVALGIVLLPALFIAPRLETCDTRHKQTQLHKTRKQTDEAR